MTHIEFSGAGLKVNIAKARQNEEHSQRTIQYCIMEEGVKEDSQKPMIECLLYQTCPTTCSFCIRVLTSSG